ncbi:PQQ-binding-like beta-propeller repeat protein [Fervidobacterium pennivorans subsp. shakshaketiis]|uniref:Pyrrolo-quinoline quinone repeat domain-containing protein n=1 Tax=Fervidobacterium pennivorans (strain DSM 9078 / Ven5) TaxID=771875 RepID=H9UBT8_FERPD|nr:PQQ-binding-like beta-propeller repeat protein [Fervidobacterium pennivorans]AFG34981.1 hypothetical protein Ferpe_0867 [Fervidobacterium pennivorans DSM 9078]QIV78125.1 PQQ-binding-like beta-propeller repeat protein [Fervidobacterium pennivorans subsp. keratinolyticus]
MKRRLLAVTSLSFLLATLLFSGALIVTTSGIVDEAGNVLKSVSALDVLFDGTQYYYVATDGIYSLDGTTKIDIRNSQRVGINYVLSNSKVYKIEKGAATSIGTVSSKMKSVYVVSDYIIGIESNQIVCYYAGNVVWSIPTDATFFKISEQYMAVFGSQTQLFNISNVRFVKLERVYPKFSDYVYFAGYHVFSDGSKIYFYRGSARLSTTFPYKGTLFTDGKYLYSGNFLITADLVQKELKFTVKSLVPVATSEEEEETTVVQEPVTVQSPVQQSTTPSTSQKQSGEEQQQKEEITIVKPSESQQQPKTPKLYELLWKVVLNDSISGKPAVKGTVSYVPTTKGTVIAIDGGKIIWSYRTNFVITAHTTVGNHIYVGSWDDTIYALREDGTLAWKLSLDSDIAYGPAWDGYLLYVVTDKGTLYIIKDEGKTGTIKSSYKVGTYPSIPPSVSLSGKVYVVDGAGNLWRDKSIDSFAGKPKNLPIYLETPYVSKQVGFSLIDEYGNVYEFIPMKEGTVVFKEKNNFLTISAEITDAVLGKEKLYVIDSNGKFQVIDKNTKKVLFTDTVPNGKYISLSNGYLFVFGKEVRCYYVNDTPSGYWNSLYGNPMNWNSAVK